MWSIGEAYKGEGEIAKVIDYMQISLDYKRSVNHPYAVEDAAKVISLKKQLKGYLENE